MRYSHNRIIGRRGGEYPNGRNSGVKLGKVSDHPPSPTAFLKLRTACPMAYLAGAQPCSATATEFLQRAASARIVRIPNTPGISLPLEASKRTVTFCLPSTNSAGIEYSTSKNRTSCSGLRLSVSCPPTFFPSTKISKDPFRRASLLNVTTSPIGRPASTGRSNENHFVPRRP